MKSTSQHEKRQPVPNQWSNSRKKKPNTVLLIIISLVVAALCGLTAFLVHHFHAKEDTQKQPETSQTQDIAPTSVPETEPAAP